VTHPHEPTRPRDSAEIARDLAGARVGALFYVGRFRDRPGASRIADFGHWGEVADALGIDPVASADRVFSCAADAQTSTALLVVEHSLPDGTVRRALAGAAARAGHRLEDEPLTFTTLDIQHVRYLLAAPQPGLLVLVPGRRPDEIVQFASAGGLPDATGAEAARFFAFAPPDSLGSMPPWPRTIVAAQAAITLGDDGAVVTFEAKSTSSEQSVRDAATMEKTLDDLLHVDLVLFRMPLFDPVHFHAEGELVRMTTHLLPSDVDWLLAFGR
jgi:hypothetical protein